MIDGVNLKDQIEHLLCYSVASPLVLPVLLPGPFADCILPLLPGSYLSPYQLNLAVSTGLISFL